MAIGNPVSTTSSSVASKTSSVIATAGQTLFTVPAGYVTNHISVFRNGIRLVDGRDYEARNGATVTLLAAATVGDVIEFHVFDTFSVADAVTNQGGTIFGDLTVEGSIGNITGVAATFTGAVSVGGVLTYEDVTNIDSVGIITARSDLSIADKIIHTGDTNTAIRFPAADTITAETGGSERLRIDSNGNMGLGTNSPSNILHISSADPRLRITDTSGTTSNVQADILFQAGLGGSAVAQIGYTANDDIFRIKTTGAKPVVIGTADAERLRIDSSGRMGLGTNSPTDHGGYGGTLEISGSPGGALYLKSGSDVGQLGMNSSGLQLRTRTAKDILFTTNNTERMRIDSFGRLGFGASNNSSYDSNAQNVLIASDSHTGITIRSGGSSHFAMIHFADGTTGAAQQRAGRILYQHDGNNMTFHTDNTERLRIDGSGQMGLGMTPGKLLDLQATSGLAMRYYNGATFRAGLEVATNAGDMVSSSSAGDFCIRSQSNLLVSTGGNTERLRIDTSGRLLVGTTTTPPIPNGQKIYVAGTGSIDSGIQCARFHPSYGGYAINIGRSRGSTIGTFTSVSNNDDLGSINWHGADGTDMSSMAASINAEVDGTPGSNDMPGRLVFSTTADGASSPTERLRIDSSGRMGLGTNSPAEKLHVNATGTTAGDGAIVARFYDAAQSKGLFLGYDSNEVGGTIYGANLLTFQTYNGSSWGERMRIDGSGRMGLGTNSPTDHGGYGGTLEISGSPGGALYLKSGSDVGQLGMNSSGLQLRTRSAKDILFTTNNTERMRIDSDGRLLVGTSSNTYNNAKLQVAGSNSTSYISMLNTSASDADGMGYNILAFRRRQSGTEESTSANIASTHDGTGDDQKGRLVFATNDGNDLNAPTERMRITSGGQVNIGGNFTQSGFTSQITRNSSESDILCLKGNVHNSFIRFQDTDSTSDFTVGSDDGSGAGAGSFVIYDRNNNAYRFYLNSSGNLGIGAIPSRKLTVGGDINVASGSNIESTSSGGTLRVQGGSTYPGGNILLGGGSGTNDIRFNTTGATATQTERMRIDSSGDVGIGNDATFPIFTDDQSLILGGGVGSVGLQIYSSTTGYGGVYFGDANSGSGRYRGYVEYKHNDDWLRFAVNGQERMRIDSSGRLLLGTTTEGVGDASDLTIANSTRAGITLRSNSSEFGTIAFSDATSGIGEYDGVIAYEHSNQAMRFSTASTERMRITSNGRIYANATVNSGFISGSTNYFAVTSSTATGHYMRAGNEPAVHVRSGAPALFVGRQSSDGEMVGFYQAGTKEGNISVLGTDVTLNGATLSRWSQLAGGAERIEILRGSVLSNLDEMCEWGDEDNEQLNRMKISDVEGDINVAGVFRCWDDDDDTYTNDFYCAMTGDFVIRIAQGTTVARGDLLMSAGDGTAKPQDDDIVRSKTIAKVTSTTVSATYSDGSYCVPCVLMAC